MHSVLKLILSILVYEYFEFDCTLFFMLLLFILLISIQVQSALIKFYINFLTFQVGSVTFDGETIDGAPPLWCAAAAGHLNLVKVLVKYKASVNSATKTNSTPLRAACFDGHFEIAKYLIQHGADIEIANRHGHTCLMIACYKGHFEISKFLVECGADVNRKSVKGK